MKDISVYCLLDSDYHIAQQFERRFAEAREKDIRLQIWSKKELENYLLVPSAIYRLASKLVRKGITGPTVEQITAKMEELAQLMKQNVLDNYADEIGRKQGVKSANESAREWLQNYWNTFEGRMSRVSGKMMLIELTKWLQTQFTLSLNAVRLASELRRDEIDLEVSEFLSAFEYNEPLPNQSLASPPDQTR